MAPPVPALLAVLLAAAAPADAGVAPPLAVQVRATPAEVTLGDPFTIELMVTHRLDQRVELSLEDQSGDFELMGQERKRVDGPTSATTTFDVKASAFKLGPLTTPELLLTTTQDDGQTATLLARGAAITVVGSLPKDAEKNGADLFDIHDPKEVPIRTWRLVYALLAALAVGAAAYAFLRWWKNRALAPAPAAPPPVPLANRTLKALDELRAADLPGQGKVREFYFRLSEILRGYLGERYGFEALECTSSELLAALGRLHTPGLPMDLVTRFTEDADLARYARAPLDAGICKGSLEAAYRVVNITSQELHVRN